MKSTRYSRHAPDDKGQERSALAQFMTGMDGLALNDKAPFVIVATRRPQDMDEAFYRRLLNKVYLGLPGVDARKQILEGLVKGDLDGEDDSGVEGEKKLGGVTVEALAGQTVGYSGSDLNNLCAEAALLWAVERAMERAKEGEAAQGMEKDDEAGDEEVKEERVKLTVAHFAKALNKVRPSVSPVMEKGLQDFVKRFNPGAI